ncbi:MAG: hypothetical protein OXG85_14590 [Chloroflexi bacterium]|nr:hypothetical protein [Chloroflexota bacterium]
MLVPTYAFFVNVLKWGGAWLPLIVPAMFGKACNIFLLRQYFLTIPREMEEAAQIDGAGRWIYRFEDDAYGWRLIEIPFVDFQRRSDW